MLARHAVAAADTALPWSLKRASAVQAEFEARLDFDEELPPLDTVALSRRIGTLGQQVQVCLRLRLRLHLTTSVCELRQWLSRPSMSKVSFCSNPIHHTCVRVLFCAL